MLKPLSEEEYATAVVQRHFEQINAMWLRNRHCLDLLGVLCTAHSTGGWCLAMSDRQQKIVEAPELLRWLPQLARPAWTATPERTPGTAIWFIVGAPGNWTCLRMQRPLVMCH